MRGTGQGGVRYCLDELGLAWTGTRGVPAGPDGRDGRATPMPGGRPSSPVLGGRGGRPAAGRLETGAVPDLRPGARDCAGAEPLAAPSARAAQAKGADRGLHRPGRVASPMLVTAPIIRRRAVVVRRRPPRGPRAPRLHRQPPVHAPAGRGAWPRAGFTVDLPLLPGHGTAVEDMVPTRWDGLVGSGRGCLPGAWPPAASGWRWPGCPWAGR